MCSRPDQWTATLAIAPTPQTGPEVRLQQMRGPTGCLPRRIVGLRASDPSNTGQAQLLAVGLEADGSGRIVEYALDPSNFGAGSLWVPHHYRLPGSIYITSLTVWGAGAVLILTLE